MRKEIIGSLDREELRSADVNKLLPGFYSIFTGVI
jgi:hypothetical protein